MRVPLAMGFSMDTIVDEEALKKAFDLFDTDKSGTLTADELIAILTRPGTPKTMSLDDAQAFLSYFDKNGDGVLESSLD